MSDVSEEQNVRGGMCWVKMSQRTISPTRLNWKPSALHLSWHTRACEEGT